MPRPSELSKNIIRKKNGKFFEIISVSVLILSRQFFLLLHSAYHSDQQRIIITSFALRRNVKKREPRMNWKEDEINSKSECSNLRIIQNYHQQFIVLKLNFAFVLPSGSIRIRQRKSCFTSTEKFLIDFFSTWNVFRWESNQFLPSKINRKHMLAKITCFCIEKPFLNAISVLGWDWMIDKI